MILGLKSSLPASCQGFHKTDPLKIFLSPKWRQIEHLSLRFSPQFPGFQLSCLFLRWYPLIFPLHHHFCEVSSCHQPDPMFTFPFRSSSCRRMGFGRGAATLSWIPREATGVTWDISWWGFLNQRGTPSYHPCSSDFPLQSKLFGEPHDCMETSWNLHISLALPPTQTVENRWKQHTCSYPIAAAGRVSHHNRCISNNILWVKIEGPLWYTIYHHLPVVW